MNEVAKRMRQSYEVTGDKWILRAASEDWDEPGDSARCDEGESAPP